MQIKKPAVEQDILRAALKEFTRCGFRQASMRDIAELAGVTVGNIYAYFPGKEALFDALVSHVAHQLAALVDQPIEGDLRTPYRAIAYMADQLRDLFMENRESFLLLMCSSEGSRYETAKDELTAAAAERIRSELECCDSSRRWDGVLLLALATAVVDGLIYIVAHAKTLTHIDDLIAPFLNTTLSSIAALCKEGETAQ